MRPFFAARNRCKGRRTLLPLPPRIAMSRTAAHAHKFDWADPLLFEDLLSEDERLVRDSARA